MSNCGRNAAAVVVDEYHKQSTRDVEKNQLDSCVFAHKKGTGGVPFLGTNTSLDICMFEKAMSTYKGICFKAAMSDEIELLVFSV